METWTSYKGKYLRQISDTGYSNEEIAICLEYAKPIFNKGLPVIYDLTHLAKLVGYEQTYIVAAAFATNSFYREYKVPKASGGIRLISEPLPSLKEIQRWILDEILSKLNSSIYAKGFLPDKSIKDNARFHRGQKKLLSLDIKSFFPSVRAGRVYNLFSRLGYQKHVAFYLTRLCTLNECLPQGSPTSPMLSNVISLRLDRRLSGYARKYRIRYTRYADDLSFSGDFNEHKLIRFVRLVLRDEGFELNDEKTRLMQPHQRQEVTGVVVNKHLQAPKTTRRQFRSDMYYIKKYGLESHMIKRKIVQANYLKHLLGIGNFILFVNPKDLEVANDINFLHRLHREQIALIT